jgi:hypothetical protein
LERGSVRGEVTLDGRPLESGSIRFIPAETRGGPTAGGDILDGSYQIPRAKGPAVGRYRVEVNAPHKTGRQIISPTAAQKPGARSKAPVPSTAEGNTSAESSEPNLNPMQAAPMIDEWVDQIPATYNTESKLELDVKAGRNTFDVHMQSK